jgi:DnaJ-class molecular chaperone
MTHILIALAVTAAWSLFVLVRPSSSCRRCGGWGHRTRRRSACPRCKGTGRQFRPGARIVHKAAARSLRYVRDK